MAHADRKNMQATIMARMLLVFFRVAHDIYNRQRNPGVVFPEWLVAMAIRVNDDRGRKPSSLSQIARTTGLPRNTVRRCVGQLIEHGVVKRVGTSYTRDPHYAARLKQRDVDRLARIVMFTADVLKRVK